MRLLDRVRSSWSPRDESTRDAGQGYYEGMASGAAVLLTYTTDQNREKLPVDLIVKAAQAYQTNGVVWACIVARMTLLAQASFKFRALTDKHLYGNQTLSILEEPWPNATAGDLWARMEVDNSLAGNSYWWKAEPDRLVHLPPAEVTIVSQKVNQGGRTYRDILGYAWEPNPVPPAGQRPPPQFFTVDEIAHWAPIPDPTANFRGQSWFRAIMLESDADYGLTSYKTKYMDHGTPVAAIKYNRQLRGDTVDFIQDRLNYKYGGVANAWRPLILDQGADPIMGKGLEELDLRSIQAGGEQRICAAAGVPGILLGLKEADTNETYQQAMRLFSDMTVRSLWGSGCAALEKFIDDMPAGAQLWFDTTDIAALQAAETERAQVTQVKAAGTLTLIQAGFTRESVIAAVDSGDFGLLVADPNAPTPGVVERETINVADMGPPVTGPDSGNDANATTVNRPPKTGSPPGGGQVLTQPQTPASKKPMPASFPTAPSAANGKG